MIKLCFSLLLSFLLVNAFSQTGQINGKVIDSKTLEPLPFANVFINNTTIGVAADVNGDFTLKNVPIGIADVVFSFVGYTTYQVKLTVNTDELLKITIRLVPDEIELENVEVKGTRDKEWERQLKKFEKIFLGSSKYAAGCKILNPWELEFKEDKSQFTAIANKPLQIENLSLGYKQYYYLRGFRANAEIFFILGNSRFEPLLTDDPAVAAKWDANRKEVYKGSVRHLFKSLLAKNTKQQGFLLYTDPSSEKNTPRQPVFSLNKNVVSYKTDSAVLPGKFPGEFRVLMKKKVEVHFTSRYANLKTYQDIPYPVGWIEATGNHVEINANGVILNPDKVITSGYLSEARMAEELPLDYKESVGSSVINDKPTSTSTLLSDSEIMRLQEQIYLHTDKPYYYKGEMIWFKGYINYQMPALRDTLSRVLYVDLIDSKQSILQTFLLPIDSGFVKGNLLLADTLKGGDYWMRAYTTWMRNYGDHQFFIKPIPVLELTDKVLRGEQKEISDIATNKLTIKTDKENYLPREKITVTLAVNDFYNNPARADLSVSVTDVQQVFSVERANIISTFNKKFSSSDLSKREFKYPIDLGLSIRGKFLNNKEKPERANITIVQGKFEDVITVDSDSLGDFNITGFTFFDTVQFAFQAMNSKKKPYGQVVLNQRSKPDVQKEYLKLNLPLEPSENPQRLVVNYQPDKDTRVLEEVTVTASKIEITKQPVLHGQAQHVIEGIDVVRSVAGGNIVTALQGKVPGLQIVSYWDEQLVQQYKIKIRGGSSSITGSGEPLILVDGVPFGASDQSAVKQLAVIPPENVDRIEVITKVSPIYGIRGTNGVIAVYTKSGMYARPGALNSIDTKSFQILPLMGYSRSLNFISPDYGAKDDRHQQADYRSTLFWSPGVRTDDSGIATFSFYAADLATSYRIVVEGMDQFGKAVRAEHLIKIN